ncbi:PIG-L deacetylase family protein [Parvularcula dongshanensis]|uniref:LmbE family N-acetylglucosaminyl deacetylase n=1 Tax=Parvularcula dongshanensis TaxID=1173995 RepID=A0A840I2A8_9PROT|nr:PIG-L family deacetylase [Parvularcula dongshanensis]MBB4658422.1 LmbE family N-acetylglucosaminyl deacetylase [Parvularcula dongshanensis]
MIDRPVDWAAFARLSGAGRGIVAIAPHPDDETLGCGGLIVQARQRGVPVHVALLTDGAASHPQSRDWPPRRLARLRTTELRRALARLGVDTPPLLLGLPDAGTLGIPLSQRDTALRRLAALIVRVRPGLVLTTWRREPHCDHQTAYALGRAACDRTGARLAEYLVWTPLLGAAGDDPLPGEGRSVRLRLGAARLQKQFALDAHLSQLGAVVGDDPEGFALTSPQRRTMTGPHETYVL